MEIEQPSAPRQRGVPAELSAVWARRIMLILSLLFGLYLRTLSLTDWDADTSQHPDERFFTNVATTLRLPASLGELYDSARSPINPRNYDQVPLYVYGPFPQLLTRAVAVALTPNDQPDGKPILPVMVRSLNGPARVGLDPAHPNEMRTDYGQLVPNPERSFLKFPLLQQIFNPAGRNLTSYGEITKVGRSLAVLFDMGSLGLIYLLGRRLFDRRAALIATLLAAASVMPIQQSHFFVDPIFSTFFCLLSLYWAVRVAQGGRWPTYVLLGLSIGAAMANRITLATLGGMALIAAVIAAIRYAQSRPLATLEELNLPELSQFWLATERFRRRELPLLLLAGAVTLLSFRILAPDSFIGSNDSSPVISETASFFQGKAFFDIRPDPRFIGDLVEVQSLVSGESDFPPGQQWVGRTAYVFPWVNMVLWGMGPGLGLAAWLGLAAFALAGLRRLLWPRPNAPPLSPAWVLFAWAVFYFGWQGRQFAITLRYLLPIYGALTIFGAWGLVRVWDWAGARRGLQRALGYAVPIISMLATVAWAYAFSRIYTQPHSRVIAAQWLAEHAPAGSYVMSESWDDPLPLQVTPAGWGSTYQGIQSFPYNEDEPHKYLGGYGADGNYQEGLLDQLDRADYITLTSNRIYDSTSRLRMRYPALMRYYHALFAGDLGFKLVAEVTSYPRLLGIAIPDQAAEEAFHVYDHPRVLIFEKTLGYSRALAEALITQDVLWGEVYKSPVRIAERNQTALRLTNAQWSRYTQGGTWSAMFNRESLVNTVAPLLWLAVLELLGLAGFALFFRLLPGLPDRGYSLSKILALLVVAYLAWLAGSLGNDAGVPGQGNLHGVGWGPFPLAFTPATLWLCAAPLLAAGAALAWLSRSELLAFWQARRSAIIGGEAVFLGFLLLGLLLRWFNPDLWHPARGGEKPMDFAFFNAVLKSAAFPPYDPWHAGGSINYYYFGFVLVGALTQLTTVVPSIAYNLAVATIFALTALGAWGVVYNLLIGQHRPTDETGRRAERRALVSAGFAPALLLLLGNLAQAGWFLSGYAAEQVAKGRSEWAFWDATRIVEGTVNEFPAFTFLFADLHAHLLVMPLSLALLGLAVAYARCLGKSQSAARLLPVFILLMGLLAGAIRATNTWDYPTFVGLAALTMASAAWRNSRGRRPLPWTLLWVLGPPLLMLALGNLLFAPFSANFATESSGFKLWEEGLAPTLTARLLLAQRTSVWQIAQLYGHWLFVAAAAGLLLARRLVGSLQTWIIGGVLALGFVVGALLGQPAILLLLPMVFMAVWLVWELRRAPVALLLPGLWLGAGLALCAMVELVVVKGDVGRMNTVFKFGLHAWALFALGTAALLPRLWHAERQPQPAAKANPRALGTYFLRGGLVLLGVAALVYPLTAVPARLADRWAPEAPHGLDGMGFLQTISTQRFGAPFSLDEDAAAIDWLQRNIAGTPVIIEAHLPSYQWAGRVSAYTGLPTLLGWEWHQVQQRNAVGAGPVIANRQQTVALIYNTPDAGTALEQLRLYGVQYVYVGGVERATYASEGLAKFAAMTATGELERVFQQGQTAIYRVVDPGTPRMLTSDLPISVPTLTTPPPLRLETPLHELAVVDEYAWNSLVQGNSLLSALLWLAFFYGVGLLGLPVAYAVFGGWRDGGVAWARLIGLLLLGYTVWLPTALGFWHYDRWALLGGLALVIALDVGVLWWLGRTSSDEVEPNGLIRAGLGCVVKRLRTNWRAILWSEAIFLTGFAALALVRALNPDLWHPIWGGEKPMEFGFLNAILRSPVMPPYDPFFSGGYINYYYYGLYLISLPIKATGIAPAVGFNLGLATIFGLTLAGAFALVRQMSGRVRYGLLAAWLVGVAGNLAGVFAAGWSRGLGAVVAALADGGLAGFGERLGDWYVGPSRVIPNTINEFPAFSFLFADLHPHLIALPMTLLVAALGYRFVAAPGRRTQAAHQWQPLALPLLLLALTLGTLAVTNSWDFPTYGLLAGLALLGAAWRDHRPHARGVPWAALARAALLALGAGLGGLVLYAPFFDRYWAPVGGIGVVGWGDATLVTDYLLIYGLFIAVLLPTLGGTLWHTLRQQQPKAKWLALVGLIIVFVGAAFIPSLGLRLSLSLLLLAGLSLLPRRALGSLWYALLLACVAWAVSLGVEFVYIRDHLDGGDWYRMNTVFKFGLQAWVLLALAAAASLPAMLRGLRRIGGAAAQTTGLTALALLAALAAVYPLVALPSRIANHLAVTTGPTLDGLAFMDQAQFSYDCEAFGGCDAGAGTLMIDLSGDAEAIRWLNSTIRGTPVVVQSDLAFYRGYGIRIAANTGLPTVVSALHENEQRDPAAAARRSAEVEEFYRTGDIDTTLRFLARYNVAYIYVGAVERAIYPTAGLAKFAQLRGTYLTPVFDTPQVQIYAVSGVSPSYAAPPPADFTADLPAHNPAHLPAGQGSAGLAELEKANKANPTNGPLAFGLAERYRDLGRLADAARVLEAPARANPKDLGVLHLRGDILAQAGRYDEAEDAYMLAAQAEPSAGNWNKLGTALLDWGQRDKAEIALSQAVAADPSVPEPYYQLGRLFAQTGNRERAKLELATYLKLAPAGQYAQAAQLLLAELEAGQ